MNFKTKGKPGENKPRQEINPLRPNTSTGMPDYALRKEMALQARDELIPLEAERQDNVESGEIPKSPNQYHNKFELLNNYVNDLIAIIYTLEDQLKQTSNMKIVGKTMVAGLAHDLRNPIAVISSCAQFCIENEKLTPLTEKYLKMIQENGKTATNLLNQFLDFSKAELTFKLLNLNQIIKKAWELAEMDAGRDKASLEADLAEDLPEVFGDTEKIERLFLNLFLNAIQATSLRNQGGIITVQSRFRSPCEMAEVIIVDDGPGIPEEIKGKLFEPFFTTKREGTGLGLHLCRFFVEQHKGKIAIEKARERGTKVTVWIPIKPQNSELDPTKVIRMRQN